MSFDEPPCDPAGEEADLRTFYGIVDALKPLSDAMHETVSTIMDCGALATMAAERLTALKQQLAAIREAIDKIVVTDGEDAGVILLSDESPTHYSELVKGQVYDFENFSPLGDALVALAKLAERLNN